MNELQLANLVRQALNRAPLGAALAQRLRAARERALARQKTEAAPALAWADNVLGTLGGWSGLTVRVMLPLVILAAGVSGVYSWQQYQRAAEVEEIDAQLLTDDLPIDAYLDRGFQNWLKKTSTGQ